MMMIKVNKNQGCSQYPKQKQQTCTRDKVLHGGGWENVNVKP